MDKRELIEYCLTYPDVFEDYPFDENWTAMRHSGNKKSFAFIYERDGRLCVNLKCDPMKADFLRRVYHDATAGYRMNKEHWNTIIIGGDVPDIQLFEMIGDSHELTKPKTKRRRK